MKKKCRKCGRDLELSQFYKDRLGKDGHLNACQDCVRKINRDRYHEKKFAKEWEEMRAVIDLMKEEGHLPNDRNI